MGVEDFFVCIYPPGVEHTLTTIDGINYSGFQGDSTILVDELRSFLRTLCGNEECKAPDHDHYEYIKDKTLILSLWIEKDQLHCWMLTLTGCLAWYEEELEHIYTIFQIMQHKFAGIYAHHPATGGLPPERSEFIQQIRSHYDNKWLFCQKIYPLHKPISHRDFYSYVHSFKYQFFERKKQ